MMIARSSTIMLALALLASTMLTPGAGAAELTRGGQPAELTIAAGGAHGVRVTLKPVGMELPASPSLLDLEIKEPVIKVRTIENSVRARVGALDVEIIPLPLTVIVRSGPHVRLSVRRLI